MEETEVRVGQVEDMTVEMTKTIIAVMKRQKTKQQKLTDLECTSRRNSIRIVGVAEGEEGKSVMRFMSGLNKPQICILKYSGLIVPPHQNQDPKPRASRINTMELGAASGTTTKHLDRALSV